MVLGYQVVKVPTVHRNLQKYKCRWGALAPPQSTPGSPIPDAQTT